MKKIASMNASGKYLYQKASPFINTAISVVMLCVASMANAANVTLQKIDFATLSGDRLEMQLKFDGAPPEPRSYTIDQPARITLDLFSVSSGLDTKYHSLGVGNARSVTVLEAGDRTRVVVNLTQMVAYSTRVEGDSLYVLLGNGANAFSQSSQTASATSGSSMQAQAVDPGSRAITNIDFRRGEQGEGRVEISLSKPDVELDISQTGTNVRVSLPNAALPEALQRRLDVIDFATPVQNIDALPEGAGSTINIEANGEYDYLAYQTDELLVIDFKPVTVDDAEKRRQSKFPYSGEKLSLNFQDIEVRSVLQLIADFTNLNLVASDTVSGRITLRLQSVPWDQALELVLKTKGLDKRKVGNVLMVAPADEIANRERLELENSRQVSELAKLQTEFVQVNYAKASDIAALLSAEQGLMSSRGSVSVDARTNTLLIQDTANKLDAIRGALTYLDVPVRQVMIEARIVIASTDFSKNLGVRWGYGKSVNVGSNNSDTIASAGNLGQLNGALGTQTAFGSGLAVDLGVSATSSFALGFLTDSGFLNLEIAALESEGLSEIVSQPKLVTADGQTARIQSGVEVPYQEAASSGATSVSFKEAVLSLEVTPQITPDDRIIMELKINNDSVGQIYAGVPSIDTREIQTQVLVENGETIVLGGVYETSTVNSTSKTPLLGDIPYLGRLFKSTQKEDTKTELLIFITPKLIKDSLTVR